MTAASPALVTRTRAQTPGRTSSRTVDLLLLVLMLASPFALIEPSPYEVVFAILTVACLFSGMTIDRKLLPMILLLMIWNVSGAFALMPYLHDQTAVMFILVSFYLAFNAVVFGCLFCRDPLRRLEMMRKGYIAAGVIAATLGIVGYFQLFPGADLFTLFGRARGSFKDPNVFGPFLILPLLFLIQTALLRGLRPLYYLAALIMFIGLFLSFSRAAWMHAALSITLMLVLMFATNPSLRFRARLVTYGICAVIGLFGLVTVMLSISAVGNLFKERANLLQSYDAGETGRFGSQIKSLPLLLERPNGLGPQQFHHTFPDAPHNVYLNAFSSYGWAGGIAYLSVVLITLAIGFRYVFTASPWQIYFVPVLATFTGVAFEGAVIDTDHWRHYYLLMGIIWALAIVTINAKRRAARGAALPAKA